MAVLLLLVLPRDLSRGPLMERSDEHTLQGYHAHKKRLHRDTSLIRNSAPLAHKKLPGKFRGLLEKAMWLSCCC